MKFYDATAAREGDWWIVTVPDVGVTQVRRLSQAAEMAADLVAAMLDIPKTGFAVSVTAQLPPKIQAQARKAKVRTRQAADLQKEAAALSRSVAKTLVDSGLSGADVAAVLGVSPQRVSQLVKR